MSKRWVEEEVPPPIDLRLVPMAIAVWAGCLVGLGTGAPQSSAVAWTGAATAALGVLVLCRRGPRRAGSLVVAAGFGAAMLISMLDWHAAATNPLTAAAASGSWASVTLTVSVPARKLPDLFPAAPAANMAQTDSSKSIAPTQWILSGHADSAVVAGQEFQPGVDISVIAKGDHWSKLVPGEQIRVSGLLAPDDYAVLPGVLVKARADPISMHPAPWWQLAAASVRDHLVDTAGTLSGDAQGLLPGLVVGNTDGITPALRNDAKVTGLSHLLAVSGSHFALLCGLAVLMLRGFGPRIAAAGGSVVLLALVVLVGPGASVLRAAVMGSIALIAMSVGRQRTALPALAAAVLCLLLHDPTLSVSIGFALSVQATAGLVLLAPLWSKALQRRGIPSGWADLLAVPAAAHVATMPVIAAVSGAISMASIPANLLAAVVVGPALVLGMAAALAGPWWNWGALVLAHAVEPMLAWVAGVAHTLARWQSASLAWPASVPGVLSLAGLLTVGLLLLRHRKVRALVVAVVAGAAAILVPAQVISVGWPPAGWVLMACEVGQGDGMLLSTGEAGTAVVVDAGPDPALIDACLTRLHVSTVPLLVLSHLHADHVDGLAGVLDGRSVGAIAVGPDREAPTAWRKVLQLAAAHGAPVVALPRGTRWGSGQLSLEVLGPTGPFHGTDSDENNDSVVFMAHISGVRILMTGDIQIEAQQQLLDDGVDLAADVLEQPHHGSAKVLPAFVAAVHPAVSVIGVGLGNDYGQPSPKALAQLTKFGTTVLRTDLQGDSTVCVTNGKLSTVTRGASLPSGSSANGGKNDGS